MNLDPDLILAAALAGVEPDQVLAYKDRGESFAVVVQPGPKYVFTRGQAEAKRAELSQAEIPAPAPDLGKFLHPAIRGETNAAGQQRKSTGQKGRQKKVPS
jgi:hypothetical protein